MFIIATILGPHLESAVLVWDPCQQGNNNRHWLQICAHRHFSEHAPFLYFLQIVLSVTVCVKFFRLARVSCSLARLPVDWIPV